MQGARPPRRVRGGGLRWQAPLAASLAVLLAGCGDAVQGGSPWLFGTVALLATGAAGFAIGTLRERRAASITGAALRAALRDKQAAASLIDAWSWQTDAGHRLQQLRPPADALAADWSRNSTADAAGRLLWQHFGADGGGAEAGALRARAEAQAPFADLPVRQAGDGSRWLLRAVPRQDDGGSFSGHTGTARPTAGADALVADRAALHALLPALDDAVVVAVGDGSAAGWTLAHVNPPARQLLGSGLSTWNDVLARLPATARDAALRSADQHDAGAGLQVAPTGGAGWTLRRYVPDGGVAAGLLLLHAAPALRRRGARATVDAAAHRGADEDAAIDAGTNADLDADADADTEADNSIGSRSEGASFSFTVSHDLRAPIRVVEGFTRILKEDYGTQLDRVGNDHLDRVLAAAARMNHMIDALLALAKLSSQPLERQPVNLTQLAGYVVDDLRRGTPERDVDVDIEAGLSAHGDPTLLRLVLENLLGNAWKYTSRCPRANIALRCTLQPGAAGGGQQRVFEVRDNGAGFDMRSADRLFGLFQRLHSVNDFPGHGVGLASVKRIVQRHGGQIWADAEPGRGAAFHFTLGATSR